MKHVASTSPVATTPQSIRKAWVRPAIVLERSLEATAQTATPGERRPERVRLNGLITPLGVSGGKCP